MSASEPSPKEVPVDARITEIMRRALGEADVCAVVALPAESSHSDGAAKPDGYRASVRIDVQVEGLLRGFVLHTAMSNHFGNERRADRAAEMLLSSDTTASIPRHVKVLDVGAYRIDGGS